MKKFTNNAAIFSVVWFAGLFLQLTFGSGSIVGGRDADIEEVPWQVYLGTGCGGTIISETWIVSAAHCVDPGRSVEVEYGFSNFNENPGSIRSRQVITPSRGDIALIELEEPLEFGPTIMAIPYATEADAAAGLTDPGVMSTVSGWGATEENGDFPDQLQLVQVPIVSLDVVNERTAYDGQISDRELPAGFAEGEKDACNGDSGGPLVVPNAGGTGYILAGVVSWGEGCARPRKYGIYARVSSHAEWIEQETGLSGNPFTGNLISVKVEGRGTVTAGDIIDCGEDCRETFEDSTHVVTLTQVADAGWTFDGWSGACEGQGVCEVLVDSLKYVTATFLNRDFFQSVSLVDADLDEVLMELAPANSFSLDDMPDNISMLTVPNQEIGSLEYSVEGQTSYFWREGRDPYTLSGDDNNGDYAAWDHQLEAGTYHFTISAYSESGGSGDLMGVTRITMTLFDGPVYSAKDSRASRQFSFHSHGRELKVRSPYPGNSVGILYGIDGQQKFKWSGIQSGINLLNPGTGLEPGMYFFKLVGPHGSGPLVNQALFTYFGN